MLAGCRLSCSGLLSQRLITADTRDSTSRSSGRARTGAKVAECAVSRPSALLLTLRSSAHAPSDHRPSITGVAGMSPAISVASGVAMSRGENRSGPSYVGDVCEPPPSHLGDVLGGEVVIGQRAAGIEGRGADEEVVVDQPVVAVPPGRLSRPPGARREAGPCRRQGQSPRAALGAAPPTAAHRARCRHRGRPRRPLRPSARPDAGS